MKKSNELREKLTEVFKDKNNWNKHIEIDGDKYIYISAANEVRVICDHGTGDLEQSPLFFFVQSYKLYSMSKKLSKNY